MLKTCQVSSQERENFSRSIGGALCSPPPQAQKLKKSPGKIGLRKLKLRRSQDNTLKINKTFPWLACVASVSVGFQSKKSEERDFRSFSRAKNGARAIGLLCSETLRKCLLRRLSPARNENKIKLSAFGPQPLMANNGIIKNES